MTRALIVADPQRLDAVREGFETTVLLDLTAAVAPDRVDEISAELANAGVEINESEPRQS